MTPYYIYYLLEPDATRKIRYVGLTRNPEQRLHGHCEIGMYHNMHMTNWLQDIWPNRPVMQIVCVLEDRKIALDVEMQLTRRLRARGERLLNLNDGSRRGVVRDHRLVNRELRAQREREREREEGA